MEKEEIRANFLISRVTWETFLRVIEGKYKNASEALRNLIRVYIESHANFIACPHCGTTIPIRTSKETKPE